jgi:hypothetical protein
MHPAEQRSIIVTLRRVASTIIQARNRDIRHLLRQLDDRDGRRDASWPSRMNVPVSTLNVGVTAIDVPGRPPAPAPATRIGSGRTVRRRTAWSRLHLTQTRVDPGLPIASGPLLFAQARIDLRHQDRTEGKFAGLRLSRQPAQVTAGRIDRCAALQDARDDDRRLRLAHDG